VLNSLKLSNLAPDVCRNTRPKTKGKIKLQKPISLLSVQGGSHSSEYLASQIRSTESVQLQSVDLKLGHFPSPVSYFNTFCDSLLLFWEAFHASHIPSLCIHLPNVGPSFSLRYGARRGRLPPWTQSHVGSRVCAPSHGGWGNERLYSPSGLVDVVERPRRRKTLVRGAQAQVLSSKFTAFL